MKRHISIRVRNAALVGASIGASMVAFNAFAHPGHEPESLIHALAHEIASPRGILALFLIAVAAGLWLRKRNRRH
jgi:hypothetical protein